MSASNAPPHVQVFHFTNRISSAKIRKYKLATERGMGGGSGRDSTPASGIAHASPSPALAKPSQDSAHTMEPPSKKPKLKLNVRQPSRGSSQSQRHSQSPDTIAVSRPRRDSSLRMRHVDDMVVDSDNANTLPQQQKPSPAAPSNSSSLSSLPLPEKQPVPDKRPAPAPSKSRDYSRDFMSYYVTGGDDEENEVEEVPPPPPKPAPPSEQEPPRQGPVIQQPPPPQETRFKHHHVPPPYPPPRATPQSRAPPPLPQVNLIDTIKPAKGPKEPDTVANMIKKLEALSRTLTEFGGVPPVPKSPTMANNRSKLSSPNLTAAYRCADIYPEPDPPPQSQPRPGPAADKGAAVDNFLAMFDDDDSDEKDEADSIDCQGDSTLNEKLPNTGEPDEPLKYGIQFIQNALRSWAYQRVSSQVAQQYQQMQIQARAESQPQKRGPGRPRKFDNGDEQSSFPQNPPTVQFDLAKTPEGAAIIAFQDVLDSGCLQLNTALPTELCRALRHLYMQIDHLINQGSRTEPRWRCMSYGAQITAHKIRVEKWKEQQAKAQEEMARQHQLANLQVMQQMGLPPNIPRVPMTAEQAQQAHAIELERRRDMHHAAQQPHLTKYITTPMSMNSAAAGTSNASGPTNTARLANTSGMPKTSGPVASPINGTSAKSPTAGLGPSNVPRSSLKAPVPSSPADPQDGSIDKIKVYMPNYLPRSGQSMKFSFAPNSELALKAFGPQAFPTTNTAASNIPNRGPMNPPPAQIPTTTTGSPRPNANGPTPVLRSNAPAPSPPSLQRDDSDTIEVAMKPSVRKEPQGQSNGGKPGAKTRKLPTQDSMMGSFEAVNTSGPECRTNSISVGSPKATSMPKASDSNRMNGKASEMASRFPHPGAVIVDQ